MNRKWIATGFALAGLSLAALAQDQEPVPPAFERSDKTVEKPSDNSGEYDLFDPDINAPKMVRVQVEFIELPHETLTKLLFLRNPKSADATDLRKQVQELVSKKEAKVLETQLVVSRSGQKTTAESIHEFIYPTEYDPVRLELKTEEALKKAMASGFPSNPATPTAFETRNIGSTIEVEPTIGEEDRLIDLRFVPEFTWHTGDTSWAEIKDANGSANKVLMPDIYTLRVSTAIACIDGQYNFVAALSPKDDKGETDTTRKVMVFVKCDIMPVK